MCLHLFYLCECTTTQHVSSAPFPHAADIKCLVLMFVHCTVVYKSTYFDSHIAYLVHFVLILFIALVEGGASAYILEYPQDIPIP